MLLTGATAACRNRVGFDYPWDEQDAHKHDQGDLVEEEMSLSGFDISAQPTLM